MNKVICLSNARIVIDDIEDVHEATHLLVQSTFSKIEKLVNELRQTLGEEAEQTLIRRTYCVQIAWKDGSIEKLEALDLFDVSLMEQELLPTEDGAK